MGRNNQNDDALHIGDAIRKLLHSYHIDAKFDQSNLVASWERLVGKPIARQTKRVFIKNKVLFVEFNSPSLKHDFSLNKAQILSMFKKEFGSGIITEIILI